MWFLVSLALSLHQFLPSLIANFFLALGSCIFSRFYLKLLSITRYLKSVQLFTFLSFYRTWFRWSQFQESSLISISEQIFIFQLVLARDFWDKKKTKPVVLWSICSSNENKENIERNKKIKTNSRYTFLLLYNISLSRKKYDCAWKIQSNLTIGELYTNVSTPMLYFIPLSASWKKKERTNRWGNKKQIVR